MPGARVLAFSSSFSLGSGGRLPVASSLSPHRCCVEDIPTGLLVDMAETFFGIYIPRSGTTAHLSVQVTPSSLTAFQNWLLFPALLSNTRSSQLSKFPRGTGTKWEVAAVTSISQASSDLWKVKPD